MWRHSAPTCSGWLRTAVILRHASTTNTAVSDTGPSKNLSPTKDTENSMPSSSPVLEADKPWSSIVRTLRFIRNRLESSPRMHRHNVEAMSDRKRIEAEFNRVHRANRFYQMAGRQGDDSVEMRQFGHQTEGLSYAFMLPLCAVLWLILMMVVIPARSARKVQIAETMKHEETREAQLEERRAVKEAEFANVMRELQASEEHEN